MNKKSFDKRTKIERGVAWGFFAVLSVIFLSVLISQGKNYFSRYLYELDGPFTWDTTIYYAVGKGMSHGLLPYRDLFETKPPMIFFLSELSYLLTGDFYLCNILSFLPSSCIYGFIARSLYHREVLPQKGKIPFALVLLPPRRSLRRNVVRRI